MDDAEIHFPLDDFAAVDLSFDRFHIVASYRQFRRQLSPSQPPNNRPQLPNNWPLRFVAVRWKPPFICWS
jgi:hypothetical protein